jgi:hypothetical protein
MHHIRLLALFWMSLSTAWAEPWLVPKGPGGLDWGTDIQPLDSIPRRMDYYLVDANYIGRNIADKPADLRVPSHKDERRILRYVAGRLSSAWWAKEGPIDTSLFAAASTLEWKGPVLGPAEGAWRAIGEAISWRYGHRTALYWRDRASERTILVSRVSSSGTFAVRRAEVLTPGYASRASARISGPMRKYIKDWKDQISGCLEYIVKPVELTVWARFDKNGQLSRIKADTNQSAPDVVICLAGALIDVEAPANFESHFELYRFR